MNADIAVYTIAFFVIIFVLVHYYHQYSSQKAQNNNDRAIIRAECPDYWIVEGSKKCRNVNKLGKCLIKDERGGLMNFDTDFFNDENTGNYAKCRWAKKCQVAWDGIDHICT